MNWKTQRVLWVVGFVIDAFLLTVGASIVVSGAGYGWAFIGIALVNAASAVVQWRYTGRRRLREAQRQSSPSSTSDGR